VTQTPEAALRDPRLSALPADRLLEELLARLCQVMGADIAQFLLVEDDVLRVMSTHGVAMERAAAVRIPVGRGFSGTIAATASPAVISDTAELETFGASWAEEGVRALVGVPLVVEGAVIGVALVGSRTDRTFGDEDIQLLTAAAERAAWAVQHGLLLAAERHARDTAASVGERLDRLRIIAQELLAEMTVEGVVRTVVQRGLSLIGAFGGSVWELSEDGATLRLRGMVGYPDEVEERWSDLPVAAEGPGSEAARTGNRVVIRSVAERDERYPSLRGRASAGEAFVALPLFVHGRTIGVLGLGFDNADDLDDEGLMFIDAATAQCAAAMHRALTSEAQQRSLVAARETARRLASLQRLTAALADIRDGTSTFDVIVDELTTSLGASLVAICVLDAEASVMRTLQHHGLDPRLQDVYRAFPYVEGLPASDALLTRRPVLLHSVAERDALYPSLAEHYPVGQAWACLPLVIADRALGALSLSLPTEQAFNAEDVEFLTALADQCAHALERGRLLEGEAANRNRLEVLAEAGRIFTAPLDVQLTSLQFCRLVVGRIGDAVSVHLREADGTYSLAAAEHVDTSQTEMQRQISMRLPASVTETYDSILRDGTSVLFADLPLEAVLATVDDPDLRTGLAEHPPRSNILLPLIAGGHPIGVLSVTTVMGGAEPLGEADRDQMEELAGRLALAIDSARLLRQQTEIAHTLQRSLLPSSLPQVPGAEVAVRYLPGAEGVDVGGDFYDVIPLPSGRIGLVVGDVMGRGVRAAAVMGQIRAAVRAYSLEGHPPAALLTRLDRLVGTLEEGLLVTALYAEWDPRRGTVLCSCAGHLPPLLRLPDGPATYLELDPGVPLGVGIQSYVEVEVSLPPGSLLLAYTDGLVEGPDLPVEVGMDQLVAAIAGCEGAMDVCDGALAALRPLAATRRYDDDTALLALVTHPFGGVETVAPSRDEVATVDLPADTASPGRARALVADVLAGWGLDTLVDSATLLASELVTNGVRHAGTGLRVTLTRLDERRVRVAVTDRAPNAAVRLRVSSDDAEGGRGLFLVEHLSAGWGSLADDDGKTVWFELTA
jgi:GAF domain-containing protein/anti-sigma regulatory factor (Ser/Thr protein kinase)